VLRAHGVAASLAWMFAILAFPGVGAGLYFLLAVPRLGAVALKKRTTALLLRGQRAPGGEVSPLERIPETERSHLELATTLTGLEPSWGNQVDLLVEDSRASARIERALRDARRSIWAEYYIVKQDASGRRFLELLAQRARDGLDVRLLYDGLGSLGLDTGELRRAGGRAEVFAPLNPLRRRWSFNLRNHRKLIVVDGELGFTGGMNVGDEYSGRSRRRGLMHFLDSHLELRGPAVGDLAHTFCADWAFATAETLPEPRRPRPCEDGRSIVSIVPSGPDQEHNATAMVFFAGVATARRRVFLTSPYFIPDEPLAAALNSAALRGVDVRLLVPEKSDVWLATRAGRSYYDQLFRSGVRVFEYLPSMLHGKTMVVDGRWGVVGSANVDIRSFRLNFEMGAAVHDERFASELERTFLGQLEQSRELTREALDELGFWTRLGDNTARLLSPLL
jgi:cardiolipin synthase